MISHIMRDRVVCLARLHIQSYRSSSMRVESVLVFMERFPKIVVDNVVYINSMRFVKTTNNGGFTMDYTRKDAQIVRASKKLVDELLSLNQNNRSPRQTHIEWLKTSMFMSISMPSAAPRIC